jgi:hypothetical protein
MFAATPARFGPVLANLSMLGLTGAELIRERRAIRPELPAVSTSGAHDRFGKSAAEAPDFVRLAKPFRRTNFSWRFNRRSLKAKTRRSGERREDLGENVGGWPACWSDFRAWTPIAGRCRRRAGGGARLT